ncbi:alpha/beta fold hydrolase [Pseudorhodoplanes sinuspersici]|uniref:Alpha/beta hydrolase n=1 Tax=Pseudorhodoplanes sinuspersici TaxID=1235591 RepID=A0A1W6ZQ00_9HYPH|nr:alpha/beta hydrolase [Pseudorhodoplanes sinuspersici]ARP99327.1 alpha/beta hydrolase [Pseudorhodoplanes sinuspersici]RKE70256.1 pimeloyl-ACP methyl ester carboxylesterase [Pseudorhodoplanes sinuspersici]
MAQLADQGLLDLGTEKLEYRMIGPRPDAAPTIVMLHEGLGSVGMWNNFPDKVAAATGCGVFVYSRAGYGQSSPATLPRKPDYMHDEANKTLPRLLDAIGFQRGVLLGHSDGASIAAIYAGSHQDHRVSGLILMAPHFIVEDVSVTSIAEAREAYNNGDLRARLAKYHADVDNAFRGWNDVWLDHDFRQWDISEELAYIRVPILIIQGEDDQYGTVKQIEIAQEECYCPVDVALLPGVKHSPHREGLEATLKLVAEFTGRVLRGPGEAATAA